MTPATELSEVESQSSRLPQVATPWTWWENVGNLGCHIDHIATTWGWCPPPIKMVISGWFMMVCVITAEIWDTYRGLCQQFAKGLFCRFGAEASEQRGEKTCTSGRGRLSFGEAWSKQVKQTHYQKRDDI